MFYEMNYFHANKIWELVKKPKSHKLVWCRWLYKIKEGKSESDPSRYKARLVPKKILSVKVLIPVVKFKTIRLVSSVVAKYYLELE